jgi:hypothetical protein
VHLSLSGLPSLRRSSLPLRAAHRATTRDFPESQIRFATGRTIKGPSIPTGISPRERRHSEPRRVVRTHLSSLIALTRRLFLLTGPHTSTALRPLLPLSEDPAPHIPSRTASLRGSEGHRRFRCYHLRSPATDPLLPQQPTQWKRQFLNFFGCPGSAAPPLPGLSRRVASRRLRKLTTPSARASRSRKPAPRSSSRSLGRSSKSYHLRGGPQGRGRQNGSMPPLSKASTRSQEPPQSQGGPADHPVRHHPSRVAGCLAAGQGLAARPGCQPSAAAGGSNPGPAARQRRPMGPLRAPWTDQGPWGTGAAPAQTGPWTQKKPR